MEHRLQEWRVGFCEFFPFLWSFLGAHFSYLGNQHTRTLPIGQELGSNMGGARRHRYNWGHLSRTFFFFMVLGFELARLARQVLCHVNHTPALFTLVILGIGSDVFAQASLDCDGPYLCFLHN
jgi:hypothetical protein